MIDTKGIFLPLVTPFTDDMSSVSEVRLARLVRRFVGKGVQGFVVGGEAAEFACLSLNERKTVLEIVFRESGNAVPVLVHASSVNTMNALDLAQHAARHGARAAIVMPPHYGRYTIEEVRQHLRMVANHAGLPIVAIDLPDVYGDELWDGVLEHRGIKLAEKLAVSSTPYATTDELKIADTSVSPLGYFDDKWLTELDSEGADSWLNALRRYGVSRLVKSVYQAWDIELGPPRNPLQPLPHSELTHLLAA